MDMKFNARDHEVKFMLSATEWQRLRAVVHNNGNQGVAGYCRTHLLPVVKRDFESFLADLELESRTPAALRCAPHGTKKSEVA